MVDFYFFDSLPSTMDEARKRAFDQGKEGDVIVAAVQTKGRGRRGREWESLLGNLHFTYITYIEVALSEAPKLSLVSCVAIGEELRKWVSSKDQISYKWPNDLLLNGKKVGGLLLESFSHPEKKETCYLIGCGLNLKSYPQETRYPATSFKDEELAFELENLLGGLVVSLERTINLWKKNGFKEVHKLWMKGAAYLDSQIKVERGELFQEGIFRGIDKEGAMLLETPDEILTITVGEVL